MIFQSNSDPKPTGLWLVLLAASLLQFGCQDREVAMSIVSVKPYDKQTCKIITDEELFQVNGVVDLAMRQNYTANLRIKNNLINVPEAKGLAESDARLSVNAIALRSAVIEYSTLDQLSTGIPTKRVQPLSGTISEDSSLTLGNFELFSPDVLQQIRNAEEFFSNDNGEVRPSRTSVTILARIRLKGQTIDGRDAESNEFLYPVEVCNGCRVIYPPEMLVQRGGQLACPPRMIVDDDESSGQEKVCEAILGTDDSFVDCQTCQGLAVNSFARQLCQPPRIP
jgi:hypothetical protein